MARLIGDQNQVGLFYESGTYANASGALQWIGLVNDHDPVVNINKRSLRYGGTATRNIDLHADTVKDVRGTIVYHPQDFKMLAYALGSNVDGGSPSPYSHTISEVNSDSGNYATSGPKNPFISFGIEDHKKAPGTGKNFVRTVTGAIVDNFEMGWDQDGIIENTIDYIAQDCVHSSGVKSAITKATTQPFKGYQVKLHLPSGTVYDTMTNGTFRIANSLDKRFYNNGSQVGEASVPQGRNYSVNPTLDLDSETAKTMYEQYYLGGSEFNAILEVVESNGSRDCLITLSGCEISDMDNPFELEGVQTYSPVIVPKSANALINDSIELYNAW